MIICLRTRFHPRWYRENTIGRSLALTPTLPKLVQVTNNPMSKWCCCGGDHRRNVSSKHADSHVDALVQPLEPRKPSNLQPRRTCTAEGVTRDRETLESCRIEALSDSLGLPPQIDTLIVEDSDSEENQPRLARRASAALGIVRFRLSRHLSTEHSDKRQSHISVRNSQEEIARRAELRRLRHKRIQDELHHETSGDDTSNMSRKTLRQPLSLTSLHQACIGPRDFIEFTVPEKANHTIDSSSPKRSITLQRSPKGKDQDRNGCPGSKQDFSAAAKHGGEDNLWPATIRQDPSPDTQPCLPRTALKKTPQPKHSVHGDTNSSIRVDSYLKEDDQSTLGVWLIAQAMQSEDTTGICVESEGTTVRNDRLSQQKGIQNVKDCKEASHRRLSETSAPSTTLPYQQASSPPSLPPSTSSGKYAIDLTSKSDDEGESDILEFFPIFVRSLLEDPVEVSHPLSNPKPVPDNSSSKYNSLGPSFQPSPSRSQPNIHNLSLRDLRSLNLSPFRCKALLTTRQECMLTLISQGTQIPRSYRAKPSLRTKVPMPPQQTATRVMKRSVMLSLLLGARVLFLQTPLLRASRKPRAFVSGKLSFRQYKPALVTCCLGERFRHRSRVDSRKTFQTLVLPNTRTPLCCPKSISRAPKMQPSRLRTPTCLAARQLVLSSTIQIAKEREKLSQSDVLALR